MNVAILLIVKVPDFLQLLNVRKVLLIITTSESDKCAKDSSPLQSIHNPMQSNATVQEEGVLGGKVESDSASPPILIGHPKNCGFLSWARCHVKFSYICMMQIGADQIISNTLLQTSYFGWE